jgi:hypothetical protein
MVPEKVADHWVGIFLLFLSGREKGIETQVGPGTRFYDDENQDRSPFGLFSYRARDGARCNNTLYWRLAWSTHQLAITFHCVIESALFVTSLRGETTVRTVWTEHDAITCNAFSPAHSVLKMLSWPSISRGTLSFPSPPPSVSKLQVLDNSS